VLWLYSKLLKERIEMLPRIYHPDDIAGLNAIDTDAYYEEQLKSNPDDIWAHWCLIHKYLTHARFGDSLELFQESIKVIEPTLENLRLYHWRVLYMLIDSHSASSKELQDVINSIPETYYNEKEHQGLLRLLYIHNEAEQECHAILPIDLLYDGWWNDGPFIVNKDNLKAWTALYITHIDSPKIRNPQLYAIAGLVEPGKKPVFGYQYYYLKDLIKYITEKELRENLNWYLEIGYYKDDTVVFKVRPKFDFNMDEWENKLGLKEIRPELDSIRYLRNWK